MAVEMLGNKILAPGCRGAHYAETVTKEFHLAPRDPPRSEMTAPLTEITPNYTQPTSLAMNLHLPHVGVGWRDKGVAGTLPGPMCLHPHG